MQSQPNTPFEFDDLIVSSPEKSGGDSFTQAQIDAAYNDGIAKGRTLAMETLEATKQTTLTKITDHLEEIASSSNHQNIRHKNKTSAIVRGFLQEVCRKIFDKNEIQEITTLFEELAFPAETKKITIKMSKNSINREGADLKAIGKHLNKNINLDFYADPTLQPGEFKIDWDHGGVSATMEEITTAIDALMDRITATESDKSGDDGAKKQ